MEAVNVQEPSRLNFASWALSDTGCRRELNEDRFFVDGEAGVWAVADGMGGHDAGDLASGAIVENLRFIGTPNSAPDLRARIEHQVAAANAEIQRISKTHGGTTIGSTLAALLTFGDKYACLWAGDSRVYMVRGGVLSQLSRDHTELQDLLDKKLIHPDEASSYPRRNVITNAIGVGAEVMLDLVQGAIEHQDVFLLCSDGLTAHVADHELPAILTKGSPKEACEKLIALTLERGASDNVTVIVVQCSHDL